LAKGSKRQGMGVRTATAVFVATCTAQVAIAGNILGPPPTFYDWTGYGTGSIGQTASGASTSSTQDFSGMIAGGQIGGNLQYGHLVFGVEVDAGWSSQKSSGTSHPRGERRGSLVLAANPP
jgi:opacity protein-like surface antigen